VFVLSRKQAAKPSSTRTAGQVSKALEFALGNRPGGELEDSNNTATDFTDTATTPYRAIFVLSPARAEGR
jgi:hypothetical protein